MNSAATPDVRFETGAPGRLLGLVERYDGSNMRDIPRQWERFVSQLGDIGLETDGRHFGVHYSLSADPAIFDYMTAVAAPAETLVPTGFAERQLEPRQNAVFSYCGKASDLGVLFHHIFDRWMPESEYSPIGEPLFFEVYGKAFDAAAGEGPIEVWVPVSGAKA